MSRFSLIDVGVLQVMWKWFYYSPNTLKEMYERQEMLATKKGEVLLNFPRNLSRTN